MQPAARQGEYREQLSSAITSLISLSVMLIIVFTVIGSVFAVMGSAGETQQAQLEHMNTMSRSNVVAVAAATSTTAGGHTDVDIILANRGGISYALFSKWDVNAHYTQADSTDQSVWLPYATSLEDNSWVVAQIYLDADSTMPEVIEPGLLNPEEEALLRIRLSPSARGGTTGWMVITPPEGLPSGIAFTNP